MTLPRVLLVEDNPIDVRMIKRALKIGGLVDEPDVVNDGAPAIALLAREKAYEHIPLPDLVLLDLNLIVVDGEEVLRYIRGNPALNHLSVVILSSSPRRTARFGNVEADCYLVKPVDLDAFEKIGKEILDCYYRSKHRKAAQQSF